MNEQKKMEVIYKLMFKSDIQVWILYVNGEEFQRYVDIKKALDYISKNN